ncbi:hypothetical protein D9756_010865 [Leucocoprinus leucothites]|uniref:Uncharacterized protein n=1 Tax=Leucocoprinus leucothites TaxID=201217 RepID=A0A8H5CQ39_9AGAR|nr:hypothetical protein D9756_010865 [Leucoagaricus leucothites]
MRSLSTLITLLFATFSVFAAEYLVGVGKDETTGKKGIGFDPSVIHPVAGDVVAFEFRSGSHSAVQTTFETPCVPLEGGFNSGVFTVDDSLPVDAPNLPAVRLTINDTNPIWIFDQAGGQCQQGGVLAINPTSTQTAAQYRENAAKSPVAPLTTSTNSAPTGSASGGAAESSGTTGTGDGSNGAIGSRANVIGAVGMGVGAFMAAFLL